MPEPLAHGSSVANERLVDVVDTWAEARRASLEPLVVRDAIAARLPGSGEVTIKRLGDGHSNVTFIVTRGNQEWVLRRPPRPPYAPGAHDVLRESQMLQALASTDVPVPKVVDACDDPAAIGAPFYLMERVEGDVLRDTIPPALADAPEEIAHALVDTLVMLHAATPDRRLLPVRGSGETYLKRQVDLWQRQWSAVGIRDVSEVAEAGRRLAATIPRQREATIVHGDYKIDNVLFGPRRPARVSAILDWEMATLGDPLADVGFLAATYIEPGEPPERLLGLSAVTAADGFPSREELLQRYAAASGRDLSHLGWYQALALWKLAVLLEASYARFVAGTTDDPFFARLKAGVPALGDQALGVLES